ncbi:F0F1 ATP synthase subunit A [Reyranella sp.]|uniref:F0F1 ATP synthase subunit A n=1 Tax=Reyranella sp. TaxID=1929291 RepID=UPI00120CD8CA|nr:F0F1 ATP synthase subunit A [Reyranella sp.]TAJ89761.1 MAG: F0F1 ATP synthase subunit A [Reyranella sp.]
MAGPIEQFALTDIVKLGKIGGIDLAITNSAVYMMLTVVLSTAFLLVGARGALVPGRWQAAVELLYEAVAKALRESAGEHGARFFPLVFSLFMFVLVANLIGLVPYAFTVTSHLSVTFALAAIVFVTVTLYGLMRNGLGFFRLFLPPGVPLLLAPLIVPIEVISYLSRPISHSVRLFAVMLAGHITLKVFASFVVGLASIGAVGIVAAVLPLAMTVIITALELLMAVIQAYVFTVLTCTYINDAIHPAH